MSPVREVRLDGRVSDAGPHCAAKHEAYHEQMTTCKDRKHREYNGLADTLRDALSGQET